MVPAVLAIRAPVSRRSYIATGFALGILKYLVDAGVLYLDTGVWASPLLYLLPIAQLRFSGADPSDLVLIGLLLWTLPFAWIGGSMSVRRAQDAGIPAPLGLLFYVPIVNYVAIAALSLAPTRVPKAEPGTALTRAPLQGLDRATWAAMMGVGAGVGAGLGMTALSVYVLGEYGAGLFVGAPVLMGGVASWLFNLRRPQGLPATLALTTLTVAVTGGLMLLFALEGILCIAMAAPIAVWEPPQDSATGVGRLAFDVTGQPPVMTEWNPFRVVDAPHLQGTLKSRRGEFLLTPLPDGGTRLQGTTWYTLDMGPELYWTLWSDSLIHDIHRRVLEHIAAEAVAA